MSRLAVDNMLDAVAAGLVGSKSMVLALQTNFRLCRSKLGLPFATVSSRSQVGVLGICGFLG